jgi:arsenate reductase (glutaredoxin)
MAVTIYHNPDCGTSRNVLAMIRQSGEKPDIVEYLKTPPTREKLIDLMRDMGCTSMAELEAEAVSLWNFEHGEPISVGDEAQSWPRKS